MKCSGLRHVDISSETLKHTLMLRESKTKSPAQVNSLPGCFLSKISKETH